MRGDLDTGGRLALWGLAWLAGVAAQLQQPALWPAPVYAGLAIGALLALARLRRRAWGCALCLTLLAFAGTGWRADHRLADALPASLEGRDLVLTGVIASLPRHASNGVRFEFDVAWATLDGKPVAAPRRVMLGWSRGFGPESERPALPAGLRAGQAWRLPVRLLRPHGQFNPHAFDFELWLFERGLRATGHVREAGEQATQALGPAPGYALARLRQTLTDTIAARVDDPRAAGVLAALAVGDQGAIDRDDWDLFRTTGLSHLMSISGLHVTMFAWLAAGLVGAVWRRSARLMLWLPAPQAARWGGLVLALAYAVLAGWGVPAQRTVLMLAVFVGLRSLGLRWPSPLVLLAAAVAVTVIDPWALRQPGFWLSFSAVALLMGSAPVTGRAVAPVRGLGARVGAALRGGLRTQAVATVGLAPLSLLFFQQVSVVGFFANLVAIPLVTLAITPLALAGALVPALWAPGAALVQLLVNGLDLLAGLPGALWRTPVAPGWATAAGLLGGALLVLPLPARLRWLGLPLLLPLLWPPPESPAAGRFELVALDVGQGTAVLVRTHDHLLVYDTGPAYGPDADAGDRVLLPLLRARGESRIDMLMLSHRDSDHVGGAASLLRQMPVGELLSSLEAAHPLHSHTVPHRRCMAGQRWQWDGVAFEVLHPADAVERPVKPNSLSCVLRVRDARGASALLTGDLEAAQEGALVIADQAALRSTALMVPHHGSRTSSSAAFLDAVAPTVAFVQAGYRSRFGHPAPEVLSRYTARGIALQRSDLCGAWTWSGEGVGQCAREQGRRYWHHVN